MPTLGYYFHQLRVLPMNEIVRRAFDIGRLQLRGISQKARALLFGTGLSDQKFFDRAFVGRFPDQAAVLTHFRSRKTHLFFLDSPSLSALSEAERSSVIRQADDICAHLFDLLGSGATALGGKIDWQQDFKTGYRWNKDTYFTDIKIPYSQADIKVPWELSRFSHAVTLGQAYRLTGDEKYCREFKAQVLDWIDSNTVQFGVNWACTMDVGIRACNWIAGYSLCRDSTVFDDIFLFKFLKSLYQHGLHIRANLEYGESLTSNHYLANIAGLAYIGTFFPEFKESRAWQTFSIRELTREMEKQVYADGCDFEASTCYHRLVLELFFFPTLLCVMHDPHFDGGNFRETAVHLFGQTYTERLRGMFKVILHLLSPQGMLPQIGDNDSGRLHVWTHRAILDMRYLTNLAAIFFRDPFFKVAEFGPCPDAWWVLGEAGKRIGDSLRERSVKDTPSTSFPCSGWYIMRSNSDVAVISCGPNGQKGTGGHAHNDKLSFTLCLGGSDVIVDPGTFVYTVDLAARNLFRSTTSHNTVIVNGFEQNGIDPSGIGLFRMENQAGARVLAWESGPRSDRFKGEHFGFDRQGFHHQREILFDKQARCMEIIDTVTGLEPKATASFHVSPAIRVQRSGQDRFMIGPAIISFEGHQSADPGEYDYSKGYGERERSCCIKVHFGNRLKTVISWNG